MLIVDKRRKSIASVERLDFVFFIGKNEERALPNCEWLLESRGNIFWTLWTSPYAKKKQIFFSIRCKAL